MLKKILLLTFSLFISFVVTKQGLSKDEVPKTKIEKESELIDFNSIKKVLRNDRLEKSAKQKIKKVKKVKNKRETVNKKLYDVPGEEQMWSFLTEYWLVKNATILKWDFRKPDYGLQDSFRFFLEKLGHYEKKFKILVVNTPNISHFALPSNRGEYIFMLSLPFIRSMDLSKLEISLLLFEDFIRAEAGYFKDMVKNEDFKKLIGSNFHGGKLDHTKISKALEVYDKIVYDKGFSWKQQYEVTKQLNTILKSDLSLWNTYYKMLEKIDNLVKTNLLYQKYNQIYPSPQLQMNWLKPKK